MLNEHSDKKIMGDLNLNGSKVKAIDLGGETQ